MAEQRTVSTRTAGTAPTIYAFGQTTGGDAFIDLMHDQGAFILSAEGADLFFSAGAIPVFPTNGIVPNDRLVRFEISRSFSEAKRYALSVVFRDDRNNLSRHAIGMIEGSVTTAAHWVTGANRSIQQAQMPQQPKGGKSPVIDRVARNRKLHVLPNRFLHASSNSVYRAQWMDAFVGHCVKQQFGQVTDIALDWNPVTDHASWDKTYGFLVTGRNRLGASLSETIDICFEFMLLDMDRSLFYEVVDVGILHECAVVFHEDNPLLKQSSALDDKFKPKTWERFIRELLQASNEAAKKRKRQAVIGSLAGTVSDTFCTVLTSYGHWKPENLSRHETVDSLTNWLFANWEHGCALCEIALIPYLQRIAKDSGGGKLTDLRIPYPNPLRVGIPFDRHEVDWGTILQRAMDFVMSSNVPEIKQSWDETVRLLADVGIQSISVLRKPATRPEG
jgi:hypothetical protein